MTQPPPPESEFLLYTAPDGTIKVDVFVYDETVWLTQKRLAELFGTTKQNVSLHLANIFKEGELTEQSVVKEYLTTASDGKTYKMQYYNLDAIISVGYRVNSERATQFRIWATGTLRDFIIKGYVLDTERLKNGNHFGKDYFEDLLEKIREIRASERRFHEKISDLYAQCSADYNKNSTITQKFYATVQNKLHWATTKRTAAELIAERANAAKDHMGLTTWKHSPTGKILKSDVSVAKNFLTQPELEELNRIVTMYLDYAEMQAERHKIMTMQDWVQKLDAFLVFNEYEVLDNPGKVKAEVAKALAEKEYSKFRVEQDRTFESDFDREIKKVLKKGGKE